MWTSIALLVFVTAQRLGELAYARRNTLALLSRGAREIAAEHYPCVVLLHTLWIAGLWLLAPDQPVDIVWFAIFVLLQLLRLWVLATLKERWTTRIIVLDAAPLVHTGPYRLMRHPNYAIVAGEIAVLPLAFGLPVFALVFSILNAIVLGIRIKAENRALSKAMLQA
jgi:methyltransferase